MATNKEPRLDPRFKGLRVLTEDDFCFFCLDELRRGVPENGVCGHEAMNADTLRWARRFEEYLRTGKDLP